MDYNLQQLIKLVKKYNNKNINHGLSSIYYYIFIYGRTIMIIGLWLMLETKETVGSPKHKAQLCGILLLREKKIDSERHIALNLGLWTLMTLLWEAS